jgi:hypothetical protein
VRLTITIYLPVAMQTARFSPEEFENRRLASSSFQRTLREPTFSLDDVTGKIYQKLTAHHHQDEGTDPSNARTPA